MNGNTNGVASSELELHVSFGPPPLLLLCSSRLSRLSSRPRCGYSDRLLIKRDVWQAGGPLVGPRGSPVTSPRAKLDARRQRGWTQGRHLCIRPQSVSNIYRPTQWNVALQRRPQEQQQGAFTAMLKLRSECSAHFTATLA